MKLVRTLLDFYLVSSLHVAVSCAALVGITYHMFGLPIDFYVVFFVFFGTIVGYNFVKYDALVRASRLPVRMKMRGIIVLSALCLLGAGYCFFNLQPVSQIISVVILVFTLLYTLPFFPNKKNARNWAGIKIYIVSLCWVGVTVVLPIINAEIPITNDFFIKCIQRFILVFVLILIFEIVDLKNDDPHLQTVPQLLGIRKTKLLGVLLLLPFYFLELLRSTIDPNQLVVNAIMVFGLVGLLLFSSIQRSKYYSSLWVESVPVFWLLMTLFLHPYK